ncbi:MAG: hypothetical protein AMXMBFR33_55490 [Candidatus Xenobia bacterium]
MTRVYRWVECSTAWLLNPHGRAGWRRCVACLSECKVTRNPALWSLLISSTQQEEDGRNTREPHAGDYCRAACYDKRGESANE